MKCRTCGAPKPPIEFYGTRTECKGCKIQRTLQHRADNPGKHRQYAATQREGYKL